MINRTIKTATCLALEKSIYVCSRLDPDIKKKLANHSGKVIKVSCTKPNVDLFFKLENEIKVFQSYEKKPDVIIQGPAKDWIKLSTADDLGSSLINGEFIVIGDTRILMSLSSLIDEIDVDWGSYISKFIGDVPTEIVERSTKEMLFFSKQIKNSFIRNLDNFLHEEKSILPSKLELKSFYNRLKDLEMNADRVEAKINQFKNKI